MKRFTETCKWDDPWFRSLPGSHKLVFLYVLDRCDNAGFWEFDKEAVIFHTKLKEEHVEGALKGLERGLKGASGWVWVRRFLRHQKNEDLNPANPAHRQIISLLSDQSKRFSEVPEFLEFEGAYKGLFSPIGIGKGLVKEKGRVQRGEASIPTSEESLEFASEIALSSEECSAFMDHFQSNGWRVGGKTPMKDWKAAMRGWQRNVKAGTFRNGTTSARSKSNPNDPNHKPF